MENTSHQSDLLCLQVFISKSSNAYRFAYPNPQMVEGVSAPAYSNSGSMLNKAHHHRNLLVHNFTLINITNFKFLINNDICNISEESLKILSDKR